MTVTVIIRPNGARTEIQNMPYAGKPRGNYDLLDDIIDASRRGQVEYNRNSRTFSVARHHTSVLIQGLAAHFSKVHVIQFGGLDRCVSQCWNAPAEGAWECECACAGGNHGTRRPLGKVVADVGEAGELSVARAAPREYDVVG